MQTIVTHSGSFHADDVFAVATLQMYLNEETELIRSRDEEIIEKADWVLDVGQVYDPHNKRFDHHQPGAPVRENVGIPYAAFGLVWKEFGKELCGSQAVADLVEEKLVLPIDANDTGVELYTLNEYGIAPLSITDVIKSFESIDATTEEQLIDFKEAVGFAKHLLSQTIKKQTFKQTEVEALQKEVDTNGVEGNIFVTDHPFGTNLFIPYENIAILVRPETNQPDTNWIAKVIPKHTHTFENRAAFPSEWGGLQDEELAKVSGIQDAVFSHTKNFIFVAKSKEGAVQAAKQATINL